MNKKYKYSVNGMSINYFKREAKTVAVCADSGIDLCCRATAIMSSSLLKGSVLMNSEAVLSCLLEGEAGKTEHLSWMQHSPRKHMGEKGKPKRGTNDFWLRCNFCSLTQEWLLHSSAAIKQYQFQL